jgi:3,4-dihydroxy 2-butanone 4-phosphate synthase / GTP cyclohydrolase II
VDTGTPLEVATGTRLPTDFGDFVLRAYSDDDLAPPHLALVQGVIDGAHAPLVRIHSECMTGDVFSSRRCDCGVQLEASLHAIELEGAGVLVYLRQEGRGIGLLNKLHAYRLQDAGLDTVEANLHLGFGVDQRDYRVAVAILEDLGVSAVRLLTNNPAKVQVFEGSSIRMVARVPLVVPPTDHNRSYLAVKRLRMGHLLEEASE